MSFIRSIPYTALYKEDWVFATLEQSVGQTGRILLSEIASFNPDAWNASKSDPASEYSYIEVRSVSHLTGRIENPVLLSWEELACKTRAKLRAAKGDILLSAVRPEKGVCAVVPEHLDGAVVSNAFIVIRSNRVSPELLFFLLVAPSTLRELGDMAKGSTIPAITIKQLKNYSLPFTSLPLEFESEARKLMRNRSEEQSKPKSLADVIDEVLSERLEATDRATNTSEGQVADGFLVPYAKIKERFDVAYLMPSLAQESWRDPVVRLKDLSEDIRIGQQVQADDLQDTGVPFIRVQDLSHEELFVSHRNLAYVAPNKVKFTVAEGDLLMTRVGGLSGKCTVVTEALDGAAINQHILRIRLTHARPEFVAMYFKSRWGREQLASITVGAAQSFLQLSAVQNLTIPCPSLEDQDDIIQHVKSEINKDQEYEVLDAFKLMPFQLECVQKVTEAITNGNRKLRVELPTGVGSSKIAAAIIGSLLIRKAVRKVLYVTDRALLAEQIDEMMRQTGSDLFPGKLRVLIERGFKARSVQQLQSALDDGTDLVVLHNVNNSRLPDSELLNDKNKMYFVKQYSPKKSCIFPHYHRGEFFTVLS